MENQGSCPIDSLTFLSRVPTGEGAEKLVYKVTDGERLLAAKIFRTVNGGDESRINRSRAAMREFASYRRLGESPIAAYVPKPHGLLTGLRGNIVGLAVEWRQGETVREYYGTSRQRILLASEIGDFENRLVETWAAGIGVGSDILSEYNLIVNEDYSPRIALAECMTMRTDKDNYTGMVRSRMKYLRTYYQKDDI